MQGGKQKTQLIVSILGIFILLIAVVGISFAAFNYSKTGETVNTITTSTIVMNYNEATNGINIVNATPISDDIGKTLNGENNTFDFTVSATFSGKDVINYAITATEAEGCTIPNNKVKVYLTSANDQIEELNPTLVSALSTTSSDASGAPDGQYVLKSGTIDATMTTNYRLRMWLDSEASDVVDETSKSYRLRVNVYGKIPSEQEKVNITIPGGDQQLLGMQVSNLQQDIQIGEDNVVKGTLKYVSDFTQFSQSLKDGNFLALYFPEAKAGKNVSCEVKGSEAVLGRAVQVDPKDGTIIIKVANQQQTIDITVDGDLKRTLTLTGLTLTPKGP